MAEKKMPISWWEECLCNQKNNIKRYEQELIAKQKHVDSLRQSIAFEEMRLNEAKKAKRDSYSDNYRRQPKRTKGSDNV